jgi:hypothetical protein
MFYHLFFTMVAAHMKSESAAVYPKIQLLKEVLPWSGFHLSVVTQRHKMTELYSPTLLVFYGRLPA